MNKNNIPFELQGRVRKYLEYIFKKQNNDKKQNEILEKLNKSLKKEVLMEVYGKILFKTPRFIDNFSIETLQNLIFVTRPITFSPEEYIYKVNITHKILLLFTSIIGKLEG